ncbi:MAG TPA: hypothetical protein VIC56_01225 [Gemmatimonadota bacterium]|jgi:hypothetical protein
MSSVLAAALAASALAGAALAVVPGTGAASAAAFTLAGFALVGLVVRVNARLRLEGLGGEGLAGAAGVLGAALVLLGSSFSAAPYLTGDPVPAVFTRIELAGFALTAAWLGAAGRGLARLFAPSRAVAWGSLGATVVVAALAAWSALRPQPEHGGRGAAAFLALGLWAAALALLLRFGRAAEGEGAAE